MSRNKRKNDDDDIVVRSKSLKERADEATVRYREAKAANEELTLQIKQGKLVDLEEYQRQSAANINNIRNRLTSQIIAMSHKIVSLSQLSVSNVQDILEHDINAIFFEIYETSLKQKTRFVD